MPVNLSVKNIPDHIAARIRRRAAKHHRSLQGELVAILEEIAIKEESLTPHGFLEELRALGLRTPPRPQKSFAETEMSVRIVDASALGALVFGEPKAEEIARVLGGDHPWRPRHSFGLNWPASACRKSKPIRPRRTQF